MQQRYPLPFGGPRAWVALRPMRGDDEEAVTARGSEAAIQLLDRLLIDEPGCATGAGNAEALTVADRDRLMVWVYADAFGDSIDSVVLCTRCGERFELHFSLRELTAGCTPSEPDPDADGWWRSTEGVPFRLPTGADERAVFGLRPDEAELALLQRCTPDEVDAAELSPEVCGQVQAAMEKVAPLLEVELETVCAECGADEQVPFHAEAYAVAAIREESSRRTWEVHRLAKSYGWSLAEILSLSRARRRALVELVEREAPRY